jgi:hypothetical protein
VRRPRLGRKDAVKAGAFSSVHVKLTYHFGFGGVARQLQATLLADH